MEAFSIYVTPLNFALIQTATSQTPGSLPAIIHVMLRVLITFIVIIISSSLFGQNINSKKHYDSTKNYLEKDVYLYIGQTLHLNKIPTEQREKEYFMLDKDKNFYDNTNKQYACSLDPESLKQYNDLKSSLSADNFEKLKSALSIKCNTNFDLIEQKNFKCFGVWRHPNWTEYPNGSRYYLGLIREDNNDTCYYMYEAERGYSFPFTVLGYLAKQKLIFNKQQAELIGKEFIVRGKNYLPILSEYVVSTTDEAITFVPGQLWKTVDFYVNTTTNEKMITLESLKGVKTSVRFSDDILTNDFEQIFMPRAEADKIIKKYGQPIWKNILQGKVFIGWTKAMCKLSWGRPNDINKTITAYGTTEQWVYSGNYLYFSGNKLTAIQ